MQIQDFELSNPQSPLFENNIWKYSGIIKGLGILFEADMGSLLMSIANNGIWKYLQISRMIFLP
jgi:hypothetical protein